MFRNECANIKKLKAFAKKFIEEIEKHESIVIFHHQRPDGDCLGSQHALKIWLKLRYPNKKIYAIGSNEHLFGFLKFKFNKVPNETILKKSLGIVVDANYSNRIVNNEIILDNKIKNLIRIDHHPEEDDINYKLRFVDSSYCASAEQIADLIYTIDPQSINKEIATLLYLGIYTDSGRFFYDYTSSRTHDLTSWLFKTNFDFFNLHKNLSKRSISELEFNKYVLNNYQTYKNVIYCVLTKKQIDKLKLSDSSTNRVDFLANIDNYDIWIFFIENKDKTFRVRLRSSEKDISILAREYNGGGHKKASGAIINNKNQILEIVKKASKIPK